MRWQARTSANEDVLDFCNAQGLVFVNINKGIQVERLVNHRNQGEIQGWLERKRFFQGLFEIDGGQGSVMFFFGWNAAWKYRADPTACVSSSFQGWVDQDKCK